MPVDMKEIIAEAARKLLMDKNRKKLTVKDIVEECQITRQAFYYHFEDIPDMFRWIMEKSTEKMLHDSKEWEDPEQGLRYFFLMAVNAAPYMKTGMQTNYRCEFERLKTQYVYQLFERIVETEHLYEGYSRFEVKLFLRYHSRAVLGLLEDWSEEDTKNLDQIVHDVHLLMTGKISPEN